MHSLPGRMRLPVLFWVYTRLKVPEPELRHVAKLVGSYLMPVPTRDFTVMRCRASVQRGHVGDELHHRTYGTNLFDRVTLLAAWERHYGEVGRYFRHRDSDLLHLPVWFLKLKNPVRYAIANGFSKGRA